jgi:hypothetical protein
LHKILYNSSKELARVMFGLDTFNSMITCSKARAKVLQQNSLKHSEYKTQPLAQLPCLQTQKPRRAQAVPNKHKLLRCLLLLSSPSVSFLPEAPKALRTKRNRNVSKEDGKIGLLHEMRIQERGHSCSLCEMWSQFADWNSGVTDIREKTKRKRMLWSSSRWRHSRHSYRCIDISVGLFHARSAARLDHSGA